MDRDKERANEVASPGGMAFRSYTGGPIKVDADTREVTHKISDASMDRQNDVIETEGWELEGFLKNPVVLADHRYSVGSIIGQASEVVSRRKGLFATTRFDEEGLGAAAFGLVQRGLAKAWSVGFRSKDVHSINQGLKMKCRRCKSMKQEIIGEKDEDEVGFFWGHHFMRQELVEYSLVAVPANPNAVMTMIAKGEMNADDASFLFSKTVGDVEAEAEVISEVHEVIKGQGLAISKILDVLAAMADNQNDFFVDFAEKMSETVGAATRTVLDQSTKQSRDADSDHDGNDHEKKDDAISTDDPADEPGGGDGRDTADISSRVDGSSEARVDAMVEVMQALRKSDKNSGVRSATRNLGR